MQTTKFDLRIAHQSNLRPPDPQSPHRPPELRRIRLAPLPLPPRHQPLRHKPNPLTEIQAPDLLQDPSIPALHPAARSLHHRSREERLEQYNHEEEDRRDANPLEIVDLLEEKEARQPRSRPVEERPATPAGRRGSKQRRSLQRYPAL